MFQCVALNQSSLTTVITDKTQDGGKETFLKTKVTWINGATRYFQIGRKTQFGRCQFSSKRISKSKATPVEIQTGVSRNWKADSPSSRREVWAKITNPVLKKFNNGDSALSKSKFFIFIFYYDNVSHHTVHP